MVRPTRVLFVAAAVACGAYACSSDTFETADSGSTDAGANDVASDNAVSDSASGTDAACAIDCQGGACLSGVCQPVVLAKGLNGAYGITLRGSSLYVTEYVVHGSVLRIGKSDANQTPEVLASESAVGVAVLDPGAYISQPFSIATTATDVFWTDLGGLTAVSYTKLMRIPIAPDAGIVGYYQLCDQGEVAADELRVFWANQVSPACLTPPQPGQNGLFRGDVAIGHTGSIYYPEGPDAGDGGALVTPFAVAVNGNRVFVGAGNQVLIYDGDLVNDPNGVTDNGALVGGSTQLSATPYAITSDFGTIFWTDRGTAGNVYALPKNAPLNTAPVVLAKNQAGPLGIAAPDDDPAGYVYFTNYSAGQLVRVKKDGTTANAEVVLAGLDHPAFLTSEAKTLYFTSFGSGHGDGTVMRVAKP